MSGDVSARIPDIVRILSAQCRTNNEISSGVIKTSEFLMAAIKKITTVSKPKGVPPPNAKPAPLGNELWKLRKTHGKKRIYEKPKELIKACYQYFHWVEKNPLNETKVFCYKGKIVKTKIPKMRAMTLKGLCIYLEIGRSTWDLYRVREEFKDVVEEVESIIYEQKFTGAAASLLDGNIIARELGLKDQATHELTGANGGPIETINPDMDSREAAKIYKDLINAGK